MGIVCGESLPRRSRQFATIQLCFGYQICCGLAECLSQPLYSGSVFLNPRREYLKRVTEKGDKKTLQEVLRHSCNSFLGTL